MTDRGRSWLQFLSFLVLAMLVVLGYVASAQATSGLGLPLDDAWIHQTYARNLGLHGEWAFLPGTPSGGSTAPLWTALLAIGYWLGVDPFAWSWAWGALLLAATAWIAWRWLLTRAPGLHRGAWLAGLFVIVEWHLVWAGASGMETLAQALVVVLTLHGIERRWEPLALGLLVGLGVWIRPDAVLLLLPAVWSHVFQGPRTARTWVRQALGLAAGLLVLAIPYLSFNLALSGEIWPSTFYAKQAEYASLLAQPLGLRLVQQWGVGMVGLGVVLAPGFLLTIGRDASRGRWAKLAPAVWWATFLAVYALRLPVVYQHGRYAMVAIPVVLVLGVEGLLEAWHAPSGRVRWVLTRAWGTASVAVALVFLGLGGRAFGQDVAVINTEMVAAARWISIHTPKEAMIAAHDIGAVGYFGERRLIDLAGLITPEVIPILRDELRLAEYLEAEGADYLMTFPGWYPSLVEGRPPVFQSTAPFSPRLGGENMAVYAW